VDFCELRRLASIWSWEDIDAPAPKIAGEIGETGVSGGVGVGRKWLSGENIVGFGVNGILGRGVCGVGQARVRGRGDRGMPGREKFAAGRARGGVVAAAMLHL